MTSFGRALALAPDHRPALIALAGTLRALGRIDEAAIHYKRAVRLDTTEPGALLALAGTLAERDDVALARGAYRMLRTARPNSLRAAIGEALTLPMVQTDAAAIASSRAAFAAGLDELERSVDSLVRGRGFADVIDDLCWTNFLLAYHGEDDRALQSQYAGIVGRAVDLVAPEWRAARQRPAQRSRIRIGFASAFLVDGTVGRYFRSWIAGLDRSRFEIYVYHLHRELTPLMQELARDVDGMRRFPIGALVPSRIAPVIRNDDLDALVYPELGMDATTFALAALRLAPLQCAAWGHPVTTGHATIDVFLSCAAMEAPGADAHYTERLVLLPGIGTDYARPAIPADAARARFGLPEGVPLFLCPQSLFKIHPDNDPLFARVLAAAPDARMVVFEGRHPALTVKYRTRLAVALAAAGLRIDERLIVLPQCGHDDYMRINAACDAMLDTVRWSGGNTALDAVAACLPIATLPGTFMRGRQSAGMLSLAGVDELIARDTDDYVRIAARLATDAPWRGALKARIRDGHARVFADAAPVRALGDALQRMVREG
jgi:CRISPR-associated protein Csy1